MVAALQQIYNHLLALALPNTCPCCQSTLSAQQATNSLCTSCFTKLPWWNPSQILPPQLPKIISSFSAPCLYEEPLRQQLLNFKFHDATHLAPTLAKLLTPLTPVTLPNILLIPVPSHSARLRWRTYSHTVLLVWQLSKLTGLPCHTTALRRIKGGPPQTDLTHAQRLKLTSTSFYATPKHIHGKHIILIDDILTTGSTAKACTLALKRAGAAQVHIRTIAYTQPNS